MNLLEQRLRGNADSGKPSLALFVTAGYPDPDATVDIVLTLEQAGADVVEIGMPFSDPMADGPMIQRTSAVALSRGVNIPRILDWVSQIRTRSFLPLVLMGYINPIMRYGTERFFRDAASAGANGVILPEVPLDEWPRFGALASSHGLSGILLVAPTTARDRVAAVDEVSTGFLYAVSTTGVTGGSVNGTSIEYIRTLKSIVRRNPVLVGFGIAQPDQAAAYSREADGVVIGSALLGQLEEGKTLDEVGRWVGGIRRAMDAAKAGT
jgi:tryptophan synthase alpha chain